MMTLLKNLLLFAALTLAFSALTSCTKDESTANAGNSTAGTAPANSTSADGDQANSSQYPPLGSQLAQAQFELLDGSSMKLGDKSGKIVLATIWGTWCGPCREEMPFLVKLQDQYRDKGLEVVGLNIGDGSGNPESVDDIKAFVEKNKLNYTIARSPVASTVAFYSVTKQQVVPQTLLIGRDGHLRGVFVGGGPRIATQILQNVEKAVNEGS